MRVFDFEHSRFFMNSKARQHYYASNYFKPITEDEFVAAVATWPPKPYHNSKTRSPSAARDDYKYLKKNYGFFTDAPHIKNIWMKMHGEGKPGKDINMKIVG